MFTIAVCDDDAELCGQIKRIIQKHPASDRISVNIFHSGDELCDDVRNRGNVYDMAILDIQMEHTDGIETGKFLRKSGNNFRPVLLYISSCTDYAMQLFDLRPFNFFVKPIDPQKLLKNISEAISLILSESHLYTYSFRKTKFFIPYDQILYFESCCKKIRIHCVDDEREYYGNFKNVIARVQNPYFVRIHCSFLVNWNHVRMVSGGRLTLDNQVELAVSRSYREHVKKFYMKFVRRK